MKKIYLLLLIFNFQYSIFNLCTAQVGEWTWIKGSNIFNSTGNFGSQGVPSVNNEPPALYEACEWKDLNGNFWFYGGLEDITGIKAHNDLWKYDPATNEWTWVSGTHALNDHGNYGVQGITSPTNRPPGLGYGAASWVDLAGDLWLFGGWCDSSYSDLWKYHIATNEWTWMKGPGTGNQPGVWGTRTIPGMANNPGARTECATAWTDNNGDLWMFGGDIGQIYNDMWRYTIATNTWTWMKGSDTLNHIGRWGIMTVEDSLNEPSARWSYTRWKDAAGNFWMYGGSGLDSTGSSWQLGDLWRFNPLTNNWTWMNGSNLGTASSGHYGAKCVSSIANRPPHRKECRAAWTDPNDNFWMYGGIYSTSPFNSLGLNDLWKYCVSTNIWTWESGDSLPNQPVNWGTINVTSPSNKPADKNGAIAWTDGNGHLYLFGGTNASFGSFYNDLWKYNVDATCAPCDQNVSLPIINYTTADSTLCAGSCLSFFNFTQNATSYQWYFPGGTPSSDTSSNPNGICYFNSGTFDVILIATNSNGSDTMVKHNFLTVHPPVQFSPLTQNGDTIFSTPGYAFYQWYLDSTLIPGANNYYYVAQQSGNYISVVTDTNGCNATAQLLNVIASVNNIQSSTDYLTVQYLSGNLLLNIYSSSDLKSEIELTDVVGKIIYRENIFLRTGKNNAEISSVNFSGGIYFVKVMNEKKMLTQKIFIR